MRVPGMSPELPTETIRLRGGAVVHVRALPLGLFAEVEVLFPTPPPPTRYRTKPGSHAVERDADGKALREPDESDPTWLAERRLALRRRVSLWVFAALEGDPRLGWTVDRTQREKAPAAFADAVYEEMRAAGLTEGELLAVLRSLNRLSALTPDLVDDAERGFPPAEGGARGATGPSAPASGSTPGPSTLGPCPA
jgi:hypothetical protein